MSLVRLVSTFEMLNERKRRDKGGLTKDEKKQWRMMRREIEELLFKRTIELKNDTRESLRVPLALKVQFQAGGEAVPAQVKNLSEGGCFVTPAAPALSVGEHLNLEMIPLKSGYLLSIPMVVVWIRTTGNSEEQGMGLCFEPLRAEHQRMIFQILDNTIRSVLLDNRRFARVDTEMKVLIKHPQGTVTAKTLDLSLGGMFVVSDLAVQAGDKIAFELQAHPDKTPIQGTAEIVHLAQKQALGDKKGFGVCFDALDHKNKQMLRIFLNQKMYGGDSKD